MGISDGKPFLEIWAAICDLQNQEVQLESKRVTESTIISAGALDGVTATCDSDETVTGGGFTHVGVAENKARVVGSFMDGNGWTVVTENHSEFDPLTTTAHAVCSKITSYLFFILPKK